MGNQGIGFAIPIDMARRVMDQILKNGKVTRGYLGVVIQEVTPDLAKAFKAPESKGALVGDVSSDGPGAKAGLQKGDVIEEIHSDEGGSGGRIDGATASRIRPQSQHSRSRCDRCFAGFPGRWCWTTPWRRNRRGKPAAGGLDN
jgi:hypothetical protein